MPDQHVAVTTDTPSTISEGQSEGGTRGGAGGGCQGNSGEGPPRFRLDDLRAAPSIPGDVWFRP